jgi:hypothetical protein
MPSFSFISTAETILKELKTKNLFFISLSSSLISFDTDEALEQVFNSQQSLYLCILFKGKLINEKRYFSWK